MPPEKIRGLYRQNNQVVLLSTQKLINQFESSYAPGRKPAVTRIIGPCCRSVKFVND